jgi:hypothetical protein
MKKTKRKVTANGLFTILRPTWDVQGKEWSIENTI